MMAVFNAEAQRRRVDWEGILHGRFEIMKKSTTFISCFIVVCNENIGKSFLTAIDNPFITI